MERAVAACANEGYGLGCLGSSERSSEWIAKPIAERCRNAIRCLDPYHVVALATAALDDVHQMVWNEARRGGQKQLARELKAALFAPWKNPANLTERQQHKLARIQQLNKPLYHAYLLAQQLREIYRVATEHALALLDAWLNWPGAADSSHSSSSPRRSPTSDRGSKAAIRHGLSNECLSYCTSW
jgi:transposase